MIVQIATMDDFQPWLQLAKQVEYLFGPMALEPEFHQALEKNIRRCSALCIREEGGRNESPLIGGLLYSPSQAPSYNIGWLAVAELWRGKGVASLLMKHLLDLINSPAELTVISFGENNEAGLPSRRFYEHFGFVPAEMVPDGPEGGSRQSFRLNI